MARSLVIPFCDRLGGSRRVSGSLFQRYPVGLFLDTAGTSSGSRIWRASGACRRPRSGPRGMRSHLHEVPSILKVDDLPIAHHRARRESLARSNQVTRRRWSEICRERPSDAATVLGLDTGAGPRVTRCGASRNRAVDGTRPAVTDARASGGVNEPRSPPRLTSLGCCSDEVGALFTCNSADWR